MRSQLGKKTIHQINSMLDSGMNIRDIASKLNVSESALRWQINKAGYHIKKKNQLEPIHPVDVA